MNKYDKYRKIIKRLNENKIYLSELQIINDIDYYLEASITYDEYNKLYNEIEYVNRKTELISIDTIVRCAIDNLDKILNEDENFELREEVCWYE